jgi:hypothetical protein
MEPHRAFSRPIRRMSSQTASGIGRLPPADLRRKVHFRRTSSRCHRRSVCGRTRNDDHRARGSALLIAAMKPRSRRRRRPCPPGAEDLQLVTKDNELDYGVQRLVGGAGGQPDHTASNRYRSAESTYGTSREKEPRSSERPGRVRIGGMCVLQGWVTTRRRRQIPLYPYRRPLRPRTQIIAL